MPPAWNPKNWTDRDLTELIGELRQRLIDGASADHVSLALTRDALQEAEDEAKRRLIEVAEKNLARKRYDLR
jgi:hypothetical protein